MFYGSIEEKKQYLLKLADEQRRAAARVDSVIEVVKQFDGKMYNCRFDDAIKALSDSEVGLYVTRRYDYFIICAFPGARYNVSGRSADLLWARSWEWYGGYGPKEPYDSTDVFINGKRINASRMISALNAKKKLLYEEADRITEAAVNLEQITGEIERMRSELNAKIRSLPGAVMDACGLKMFY